MVNFMYADELPSIPVLPSSDLLPQKEYGGYNDDDGRRGLLQAYAQRDKMKGILQRHKHPTPFVQAHLGLVLGPLHVQQVADNESLAAPGVIQDDISNPTGSPPQPQTKKGYN